MVQRFILEAIHQGLRKASLADLDRVYNQSLKLNKLK